LKERDKTSGKRSQKINPMFLLKKEKRCEKNWLKNQ